MVDLGAQHQLIQPQLDTAIHEVIAASAFIKGPFVQQFEAALAAYLGTKHVIGCGNGTDALQIAFMALELKAGDEVILPCFTYAATAEVIGLLGLTPVLVDVDPDTFNIDIEAVRRAITPATKAIVPVHLFGQCADMEALLQLASAHNLYVVEDNAQSIGGTYHFSDGRKQASGTLGHIGCTSFFPSKNLGAMGDGGALYTANDELARRIRMIANHGQAVQYQHDCIGVNSRLDGMQAAILSVKLPHLDEYTAARQRVAAHYDEAFSGIPALKIPVRSRHSNHVFNQYTLRLEGLSRDSLKKYLAEHDIPSAIYYPLPLHHQQAYKGWATPQQQFPVTEQLCRQVISLPIHPMLDEEQLAHITRTVVSFCKANTTQA